jgi:outer membrane protein OmpA-like peptidoglycan-associated protein
LGEAVAAIKDRKSVTILVSGHADRVGTDDYNAKLSRLRAVAIADALAQAGVAIQATTVESFGELRPAVVTADDVNEPSNRRVEIIIR